MARIKKL